MIYDVIIVGGGASGMMSAIAIKEKHPKLKVAILEKNNRLGKKLLLTGNGKCNLSNSSIHISDYFTHCEPFIDNVLKQISPEFIKKYFLRLGLICKEDNFNRIYPYSENSSSVLDVLRYKIEQLNIDVFYDQQILTIEKVSKRKSLFLVKTTVNIFKTIKLVLACGGKSYPKTGSDGSIFTAIKGLKLKTIKQYPALVPIKVKEQSFISSVQGLRIKSQVMLSIGNKVIEKKSGEVQFRKDSVSGICIFDLSKYVGEYLTFGSLFGKNRADLKLTFDFFENIDTEELLDLVLNNIKQYPKISIADIFAFLMHKRIATAIIKLCGIKPTILASDIKLNDIKTIICKVKSFTLSPVGILSYDIAQVTAGGLDSSKFNPYTMMSTKVENLYAVGEILDVIGNCGGYNLHFAWASALILARSFDKEQ